jgi:hypothetical protein
MAVNGYVRIVVVVVVVVVRIQVKTAHNSFSLDRSLSPMS